MISKMYMCVLLLDCVHMYLVHVVCVYREYVCVCAHGAALQLCVLQEAEIQP